MKSIRHSILKKSNGITLTVLVITVIVMLILAGVTIKFSITDNNMIKSAENKGLEQELALAKELARLSMEYRTKGGNLGKIDLDKTAKEVYNNFTSQGFKLYTDGFEEEIDDYRYLLSDVYANSYQAGHGNESLMDDDDWGFYSESKISIFAKGKYENYKGVIDEEKMAEEIHVYVDVLDEFRMLYGLNTKNKRTKINFLGIPKDEYNNYNNLGEEEKEQFVQSMNSLLGPLFIMYGTDFGIKFLLSQAGVDISKINFSNFDINRIGEPGYLESIGVSQEDLNKIDNLEGDSEAKLMELYMAIMTHTPISFKDEKVLVGIEIGENPLDMYIVTQKYIGDEKEIFQIYPLDDNNVAITGITEIVGKQYVELNHGTVTIPETITGTNGITYNVSEISKMAFAEFNGIKKIEIKGSETDQKRTIILDSFAFSECPDLEEIFFSNCVCKASVGAFQECHKLKKVNLDELEFQNAIILGSNGAFFGCNLLEEVYFNKCEEIPSQMFSGCTSLVRMGNFANVKRIGAMAFSNCTNLEFIINNDEPEISGYFNFKNVETIESYAFENCKKMKLLNLNGNTKVIGSKNSGLLSSTGYTFENCENLELVIGTSGLEVLNKGDFSGTKKLALIELPESLNNIPSGCFSRGYNDGSLYICLPNRNAPADNTKPTWVSDSYNKIQLIYNKSLDDFMELINTDLSSLEDIAKSSILYDKYKYYCNQSIYNEETQSSETCKYVYDPEVGDPVNNIPAGTRYEDLPSDWKCPKCNQNRSYNSFNKFSTYRCERCYYIYDEMKEDVLRDDLPDNWKCECGNKKWSLVGYATGNLQNYLDKCCIKNLIVVPENKYTYICDSCYNVYDEMVEDVPKSELTNGCPKCGARYSWMLYGGYYSGNTKFNILENNTTELGNIEYSNDERYNNYFGEGARPGWTFTGWSKVEGNGELNENNYTFNFEPVGYSKIQANWEKIVYNLTLNTNGGTVETDMLTGTIGDVVDLPIPDGGEDKRFVRWGETYLGKYNYTKYRYYDPGSQYTFDLYKNVTLTAEWENRITLTLDLGGGNIDGPTIIKAYGGDVVSIPIPTKEGCIFNGWTQQSGNCGYFNSSNNTFNFYSGNNSYLEDTLTANWKTKYTLTIDPNNGTDAITTVEGYTGSSVNLPIPTRSGYTLDWWDITSGDGQVSSNKYRTKFYFYFKDSDATIQARWK